MTALHEAVYNGNIEIIKLLLEHQNVKVNIIDQIFIIYK